MPVVPPLIGFGLLWVTTNNSWGRSSFVWPTNIIHTISFCSCLLKFKVGTTSPPWQKLPSASTVFISITSRNHTKFLTGNNLAYQFLSIKIVDLLLFLWSSIWWRYRKWNQNVCQHFKSFKKYWPPHPFYLRLVYAPSKSYRVIRLDIISMTYSVSLKKRSWIYFLPGIILSWIPTYQHHLHICYVNSGQSHHPGHPWDSICAYW